MNRYGKAMAALMFFAFGLSAADSNTGGEHHDDQGKHGNGHVAAHGGALSAIETCAVGHLEAKLEGGTLSVWFVGGDGATTTAVRVAAREIPLLVATGHGENVRPLTLNAKPLALAEETAGDCSHFAATAEWLKDAKAFIAVGVVKFKGKPRVLRIDFPKGFDPDHDGHHEGHDDDHSGQVE